MLKSGLIFGKRVPTEKREQICKILNIQSWEAPGKHLSLPAQWGHSKKSTLSWIKDAIWGEFDGWKEKLLNQAGKQVLIKAVIQAIPGYAMSVLSFPKGFCENICSRVARLWWARNGRERGIHWRSWDVLTKNKRQGAKEVWVLKNFT